MSKTELDCHPQKRSRYKVLNFEVDFLKTEVLQIVQNGSQATRSLYVLRNGMHCLDNLCVRLTPTIHIFQYWCDRLLSSQY